MIHRCAVLGVLVVGWLLGASMASAAEADPALLWDDFNHYVRIARADLASAAGETLLAKVDDQNLLDIVEASPYKDYERTLLRASRMEEVEKTASDLAQHIRNAQISRSRDPVRINADIQKLGDDLRTGLNAIDRLRAAGQYAAPHLLEVLLDDRQESLHPHVLAAMAAIGRPLVYPFSVALPHLEPVPMGQVARVLAEIGYPECLPALKQALENSATDPTAKMIIQAAYEKLTQRVPPSASAAELYLMLSHKRYQVATDSPVIPQVNSDTGTGAVWVYDDKAGLVPIEVPGSIFGDVLAMQAARSALALNPKMDQALSLWLMSNLRRENRLSDGVVDLSYSKQFHPPQFYLEMAGPPRQHDVLNRALDDNNSELALDAIHALTATAGTDALMRKEGGVGPLLRAVSYPERRVRFSAAFAITNAQPVEDFPGSHRVVPVLAEAVRQSTVQYALVLAKEQDAVNLLVSTLQGLGFEAYGGRTIDDLADEINLSPGIDLIVTAKQDVDELQMLRLQTESNYKLSNVPIVAVVSLGVQIELSQNVKNEDRISSVIRSMDQNELEGAIQQAIETYTGKSFGPEEALEYSSTALSLLRQIAQRNDPVFNIGDAQASLFLALGDKRQSIVVQTGQALAMVATPDAQRIIADGALEVIRPIKTRVALLNSLSESAALHGNHLGQAQIEALLNLVKTSRGELAIAAAKAHGALSLPTSHVVEMLLK